jgi:hypothetical protein
MSANHARYTVWVGGFEVNDYYLGFVEATRLADYWRGQGYDDVSVELNETGGAA